ncbi:MAG TPA: RNA-binding protein [Gammaproteobacteria bacterium]|nr:RNA-binding protein [Gammaproteobacteria bacterium]
MSVKKNARTPAAPAEEEKRIRLDKWLWAARFFKTRALASEAVNGGKVHLNGKRIKPAHTVCPGDELRIRKGPVEFVVRVQKLSRRRGPASEAVLLYEETETSRAARALATEQRRVEASRNPHPKGRPSKRDRRQIHRFSGKGV